MYKRPKSLITGDTLGIISPAGKLPVPDLDKALKIIHNWGLKVKTGAHVFSAYHQFAGTDAQRMADFQAMLDDPTVRAIICARGGYGITRLINQLDFSGFLRQPKWIAGYSDITALHGHLHQLGVQSIHSIMPVTFGDESTAESVESLRKILFGESVHYETATHPLNRTGEASGEIIGGNLALLASIIGTSSEVDTAGKILFIEDISEYRYNLDRMLVQLKRAGKLAHLAGLVAGHFTDVKDNRTPFGNTPYEMVAEWTQEYNYPVCYGFPVGHEPLNLAIPCGRMAHLSVAANGIRLAFEEEKL